MLYCSRFDNVDPTVNLNKKCISAKQSKTFTLINNNQRKILVVKNHESIIPSFEESDKKLRK